MCQLITRVEPGKNFFEQKNNITEPLVFGLEIFKRLQGQDLSILLTERKRGLRILNLKIYYPYPFSPYLSS